jgi:putative Mg2+ transporter-C (MgtC) family protein
MPLDIQITIGLKLIVAAVLSMVIGIDRERRDKNAGLRTHMLVGVGACLFTALSIEAFPNADTSRVAANVVTGIGFLGAGVIYRSEDKVHDLTTAASVWITASVGMAVATGAWLVAAIATLVIWGILRMLLGLRDRL